MNLKHLRFWRLAAMALAITFFAACDDDGTGPGDEEPLDPVETAAVLDDLGASFAANEGLASYTALAPIVAQFFEPTFAPAVAAPEMEAVPTVMRTITSQVLGFALRERSLERSGPVIPDEYLGTTFVFDPVTAAYIASQRDGAPTDGVRFILYAVTPFTGDPIVDNEIGHVDLRDTSDETANRLRTIVVIGADTIIDFESTCALTQSSVDLSTAGFVSDGQTSVNFDIGMGWSLAAGLTLSIAVDVPSENLDISFVATVEDFSLETDDDPFSTGNFDIVFSIARGTNSISFNLSSLEGAVSGEVEICGGSDGADCVVVAQISGTLENVVVTDAGGNELGPDGIAALEDLFETAGDVVDTFLEFLAPALVLCFVAF